MIILLCIIASALSQCFVWHNSNIQLYPGVNGTFTINARTKNPGYLAFGMGYNLTSSSIVMSDGTSCHLMVNHSTVYPIPCSHDNQLFINNFILTINATLGNISFIAEKVDGNSGLHTSYAYIVQETYNRCDTRLGLPGLISSYSIYSFLVVQLLLMVTLHFTISYSKMQPLRSRSVSLIYFLICTSIYAFGDYIETYMLYETYAKYGCILNAYLIYSLQQATFIIPVVLLFRYITLSNINMAKISISEHPTKSLSWFHRIIYYSKYAIPIFPILYTATFAFTLTLILSISKYQCSVGLESLLVYVHLIYCVIISLCFIALLITDWVINLKLIIRCKLKDYFINTDPHSFRLEQLSILLLVISFILWTLPIFDIIAKDIIVEIAFFFTFIVSGGISLLITITKSIYYKSSFKDKMTFWDDPVLKKLFKAYCQYEWSIENFEFKEQIDDFKKLTDDKSRLEAAQKMAHMFFTGGPLEANLKKSEMDKVTHAIVKNDIRSDTFDEIYRAVTSNLADTASRFSHSKEYIKYMRSKAESSSKELLY